MIGALVRITPRFGSRMLAGPLVWLLFALVLSASCEKKKGVLDPSEISGTEPVVREILADTDNPPGAPGKRLTLVRYTIAAGAELAPHIHPGVQMASIESGVLGYQVVSGRVTVRRAGAAASETLDGPATTVLRAGDAVIEPFDMVHFGANTTAEPVVILATLITDGPALSVPVSTPPEQ